MIKRYYIILIILLIISIITLIVGIIKEIQWCTTIGIICIFGTAMLSMIGIFHTSYPDKPITAVPTNIKVTTASTNIKSICETV